MNKPIPKEIIPYKIINADGKNIWLCPHCKKELHTDSAFIVCERVGKKSYPICPNCKKRILLPVEYEVPIWTKNNKIIFAILAILCILFALWFYFF